MTEEKVEIYKVVMLGETGVGKTNIISRYVSNSFISEIKPSNSASYNSKIIYLKEEKKSIKILNIGYSWRKKISCIIKNFL